MDKKSEEELERIANQITTEMVRNLDGLKRPTEEPRPDDAIPDRKEEDR